MEEAMFSAGGLTHGRHDGKLPENASAPQRARAMGALSGESVSLSSNKVTEACRLPTHVLKVGASFQLSPICPRATASFKASGETHWPPILVHSDTGQVLDGLHRLGAARDLKSTSILAVFFSGPTDEAFLAGLRRNAESGRPLSSEERRAAVERLAKSHPLLTYRQLIGLTGASMGLVGSIKRPASNARRRAEELLANTDQHIAAIARDPSMLQCAERRELLRGLIIISDVVKMRNALPDHQRSRVRDLLLTFAERITE